MPFFNKIETINLKGINMFSLIISIIAIALVGVLAIATIWYGTDAYQEQLTDAGAAQIINESEQIENSILAFNVEQGRPPVIQDCTGNPDPTCEPLQELIDFEYLTSAPATGSEDSVWAMAIIVGGTEIKALVKTVPYDECSKSNEMMGFVVADSNPLLVAALDPVTGSPSVHVPECAVAMQSSVVCCSSAPVIP